MSCCAGGAGLPPLTSPHPHAAPASPSGPAGGQVGGMRIHQIRRRQAGNVGAVRYSVRYVDALHFAFSSKIFMRPPFCT